MDTLVCHCTKVGDTRCGLSVADAYALREFCRETIKILQAAWPDEASAPDVVQARLDELEEKDKRLSAALAVVLAKY